MINRDSPHFARLRRRAKEAGVEHIVSFGEHVKADARLITFSLHPDCSTVEARIFGAPLTYKLGAPGRHLVLNSLAVLATAALVGANLAAAALALVQLKPAVGRGSRVTLDLPGGAALLIDESYNANPASMRAAIALLGQAPVGPRGRRIAVLGDMLELGPQTADLHRGLVEPILANAIDLVFCAGEKCGRCGTPFPRTAGAAMRRLPRRLNQRSSPRSARGTRSWSRARLVPRPD